MKNDLGDFRLEVRVTDVRNEAEDIVSLGLLPLPGVAFPAFEAGAHIDLHVPGGPVRQYSLYRLPVAGEGVRVAVLRDPASRGGSAGVHQRVQAGDRLTVSAPRNHFPLQRGAMRSVLLAGGIGVTPLMCMAEQLAAAGADFTLHYCGRSRDRMAFVDALSACGHATKVQLHMDDGPAPQRFDARAAIGAPQDGTHLYVCGPAGFMAHVLDSARALGWPEDRLHREYFAAAPVDTTGDGAFELELRRSGRLIHVAADQSAAQALVDAGVDVSLSCEQGVCGTCLTAVLEGVPEHRDMYLTDEERARNDSFMPCCSRACGSRLVIDL